MLLLLRKLTLPYPFRPWHLSLVITIPKILGGLFLTFYFSAHYMGVPWKTASNSLPAFKVSPEFIGVVHDLGFIFSTFPKFFAYAAAYSIFFGGILLIIGCCTRLASFFIFWVMLITLLFREFDQSWSYIPTFVFLSISILGLWFGSGRFGLDYFISKKLKWV